MVKQGKVSEIAAASIFHFTQLTPLEAILSSRARCKCTFMNCFQRFGVTDNTNQKMSLEELLTSNLFNCHCNESQIFKR